MRASSGGFLLAIMIAGTASSGQAQTDNASPPPTLHGQIRDRGVRILQAETPAPAAPVQTPPAVTLASASVTPVSVSATPAPIVVKPAPAMPAAVIHDCPRPLGQIDLRLDATADTKTVAGGLQDGKRFAVDLARPYSSRSGPPSALASLFDAVQTSGGHISVAQYCQSSRGLGTWLAHLVGGNTPAAKPDAIAAARHYDIVLHANALDQTVTQIEFVPRAKTGA